MLDTAAPKSLDFVKARIGGQDFTCRIDRNHLSRFEKMYGPAIALFNKIRGGNWKRNDILAVLEFSIAPPPPVRSAEAVSPREAIRCRLDEMREMRAIRSDLQEPEPSAFAVAFKAHGPGTYVPLALMVLTAAIFGIPAEDAHFSDDADA